MTEPANPHLVEALEDASEYLRLGSTWAGTDEDCEKMRLAWHRSQDALSGLKLPIGTRVRSLNWAKPYGHVIGWDETLEMVVIRWDGTADHGPEACEPCEFEVIQ